MAIVRYTVEIAPNGIITINQQQIINPTDTYHLVVSSEVKLFEQNTLDNIRTHNFKCTFEPRNSPIDLPSNLFKGCVNLSEVNFVSNVRTIGMSCFENCSALKNIVLTQSMVLAANCFKNCTLLETVTIQNTDLTFIPESAFEGNDKLVTITFPVTSKITKIGKKSFKGCSSLTLTSFPTRLITIDDESFSGCIRSQLPIFPKALVTIGISAFFQFGNNRDTALGGYVDLSLHYISKIGTNAFEDSRCFGSLTLPSSLIVLEKKSFFACSTLTRISMTTKRPSKLNSIQDEVFMNCSSLENVVVLGNVISLGNRILKGSNLCDYLVVQNRSFSNFIPNLDKNNIAVDQRVRELTTYFGQNESSINAHNATYKLDLATKVISNQIVTGLTSTSVITTAIQAIFSQTKEYLNDVIYNLTSLQALDPTINATVLITYLTSLNVQFNNDFNYNAVKILNIINNYSITPIQNPFSLSINPSATSFINKMKLVIPQV